VPGPFVGYQTSRTAFYADRYRKCGLRRLDLTILWAVVTTSTVRAKHAVQDV
jgi:hypothetical protein